MTKKKAAPAKNGPSYIQQVNDTPTSKPGKLESMFALFAAGERLHRFQAERLGDHCLHTTVAGLQTKHGITFDREWTLVPTRFKANVRVKTYWFSGENLQRARVIMGWRAVA